MLRKRQMSTRRTIYLPLVFYLSSFQSVLRTLNCFRSSIICFNPYTNKKLITNVRCDFFSEMSLKQGTAKDNFQKKLDLLTEEGIV